MDSNPKIWKPALEVSSEGEVRYVGGLPAVVSVRGDRAQVCTAPVHRLVASAFAVAGTGPLVRHLNGDWRDNRPANLRWGTVAENYSDAIRHGTRKRLATPARVALWRRLRDAPPRLLRELSRAYGYVRTGAVADYAHGVRTLAAEHVGTE